MRVDDGAFAVGTLVELAHTVFAEEGQVVNDFFQILTGPHVFPSTEIRTSRHDEGFYFIRFLFATDYQELERTKRSMPLHGFGRHGRTRPWLHFA